MTTGAVVSATCDGLQPDVVVVALPLLSVTVTVQVRSNV